VGLPMYAISRVILRVGMGWLEILAVFGLILMPSEMLCC
jgi:hypothetical protein